MNYELTIGIQPGDGNYKTKLVYHMVVDDTVLSGVCNSGTDLESEIWERLTQLSLPETDPANFENLLMQQNIQIDNIKALILTKGISNEINK